MPECEANTRPLLEKASKFHHHPVSSSFPPFIGFKHHVQLKVKRDGQLFYGINSDIDQVKRKSKTTLPKKLKQLAYERTIKVGMFHRIPSLIPYSRPLVSMCLPGAVQKKNVFTRMVAPGILDKTLFKAHLTEDGHVFLALISILVPLSEVFYYILCILHGYRMVAPGILDKTLFKAHLTEDGHDGPPPIAESGRTQITKCSEKQSEALLLFKHNLSSINYTDNVLDSYCHERFSNSLTHLNLSFCLFSGEVPPDITRLHKLVSLDLSLISYINNNVFYDSGLKLRPDVFINILHNFTNLEELSLGGVNISLVLPTSINISSSLKLLSLQFIGLQGKLPHYIFNLQSLETLDLSWNTLTGNIPSKNLVKLTHLTYLDLSHNILNGTLPSWLFISPYLEYLSLSYNMMSGNVPFESFALPSLKTLDLSYNQLAGHTDMKTFRQLTNLTHMYLSFNNFSGEWELDALLSSLTNLESLDLSYSGFFVTTKNENHYVNPGFRSLRLASCKLNLFPNSFRAMKQLEWLDLSSNEIHGQIPHLAGEIGGTYGLRYVNLSHNFIIGLPQFQWYGLDYLYLQSNLIQGPFPTSICNMSKLGYLDISNNRFGGLIPECFGKLTSSLEMIDMGNNSFQGSIPSSYNDCGPLEGLILKGNQLEGELPSSLSKCQWLKVVDLGNNHLNGTFPSWLGDLPNLQVLVLRSNKFHGHIQPSFAVEFPFPNLQVLDLSHNKFVGQLPAKYFQNSNSMKIVVKNSTNPEYLIMGGIYYSFVVAVKGVDQDIPRLFFLMQMECYSWRQLKVLRYIAANIVVVDMLL
ncbi:Leucine-rich repeat-containing protein [Artemisia annua]|uniref:Leucine-rich repeat-containing protein n=1 Tax=Artemisia annua TaxID=35608 RepID=A0A2U1M6X3_ARTAN|nr:Leucine-rich repeat-containing protein [Artemisia annua]